MPWATNLEKVVGVQTTHLNMVKDLSAQEIVMRLLRKEYYLAEMINKKILAFPISKWIPNAGPAVKSSPCRGRQRQDIDKDTRLDLKLLHIAKIMFDRNFSVRRDFTSHSVMLKKRLVTVGLSMLLLSPFLVIFMLVHLFLMHAEQFYNHPTTASSR